MMIGLYYSRGVLSRIYARTFKKFLQKHYFFKANTEEDILLYMQGIGFDFMLLEVLPGRPKSVDAIRRITARIREQSPESIIILYQSNVFRKQTLAIPAAQYDLTFTDGWDILDLNRKIDHCILQRLFQLYAKTSHVKLKGIVHLGEPRNTLSTHEGLTSLGFNVALSYHMDALDLELTDVRPDYILLHCHTQTKDFERMKVMSRRVKAEFPKCAIIMTCDANLVEEYKTVHKIDENPYDLLMDMHLPAEVIGRNIMKEVMKKQQQEVSAAETSRK
jgi:hypothetical protein